MNTNKEDMRELAAQLYALVICTMTGNELQLAVRNLIKISKDNHVNPSTLLSHLLFCQCYFLSLSQSISFSWHPEPGNAARCHSGAWLHGGKVHEQDETGHFKWLSTKQRAAVEAAVPWGRPTHSNGHQDNWYGNFNAQFFTFLLRQACSQVIC